MKPKNRIMSLRLSQEEYESLKTIYTSRGVRSLSEFARDAMLQVVGQDASDGRTLEDRVQHLDGKIALLEGEVDRLSRVVACEGLVDFGTTRCRRQVVDAHQEENHLGLRERSGRAVVLCVRGPLGVPNRQGRTESSRKVRAKLRV